MDKLATATPAPGLSAEDSVTRESSGAHGAATNATKPLAVGMPEEPPRYSFVDYTGDYVLWVDYDTLRAQLAEAMAERDEFRALGLASQDEFSNEQRARTAAESELARLRSHPVDRAVVIEEIAKLFDSDPWGLTRRVYVAGSIRALATAAKAGEGK